MFNYRFNISSANGNQSLCCQDNLIVCIFVYILEIYYISLVTSQKAISRELRAICLKTAFKRDRVLKAFCCVNGDAVIVISDVYNASVG